MARGLSSSSPLSAEILQPVEPAQPLRDRLLYRLYHVAWEGWWQGLRDRLYTSWAGSSSTPFSDAPRQAEAAAAFRAA